eukprot:8319946-Pyramimonas_sp.AAC.1
MSVPASIKKGVAHSTRAVRNGANVDGLAGRAAPPVKRVLEHGALTAWMLNQQDSSLVEMQALRGRWAPNFTPGHQALRCLDEAWRWIGRMHFPTSQAALGPSEG